MTTTVHEANNVASCGGRFNFTSELGQGGFGTVLSARDRDRSWLNVAIKCIKVGSGGSILTSMLSSIRSVSQDSVLQEAWKEANLLMKLRHPNVVGFLKAYDYQDLNGRKALAIVTDLCEKGDLNSYLETSGIGVQERLQWMIQLLKGLGYIHNKGIVHRDIKPHNILITQEDTLKIGDVGLAKPLYDIQSHFGIIDKPFEDYMKSLVGTPAYMAPEVFAQHYDQKSDIFSLGLVFVMMVEVPNPLVPLGKWVKRSDFLGRLYHTVVATRLVKPSCLLQLTKATASEVNLFDNMLVANYHSRLNARDALTKVQEQCRGIQLPANPPAEPPAEPISFSCCS